MHAWAISVKDAGNLDAQVILAVIVEHQRFRATFPCAPKHVDHSVHAGFRGLNRVKLIVDGRRRAGHVVNLIDFDVDRECYIVSQELESRLPHKMQDIVLCAGKEIVQTQDVVFFCDQLVAKVRAQKSCTSGDDYALFVILI